MKFFLAALAAFAVYKAVRRHHRRRGRGCSHRRHRGGRGGWAGRGSGGWRWPFDLGTKLGLSREQEAVVNEQVKLFGARARSLSVPAETRRYLAAVIRSESFDENILGELFTSHDDAMRTLRLEAVERLAAIHDILDPTQRETLASLLERERGGDSGGPFRGAM